MDTRQPSDNATKEASKTIATYVSDMLALEKHIAAPIDGQLKSDDHRGFVDATQIVTKIKTAGEAHIAALEARLAALGGDPVGGIKTAWAQLVGGGAAALNSARSTKVSKSLRDDSTALGLSAISYTMLQATALGLGDRETAMLAKRHLDDYAPIIVAISREIPQVVLKELAIDGHSVSMSAADVAAEMTKDSWSGNTAQN